jgi:hypothetical protein
MIIKVRKEGLSERDRMFSSRFDGERYGGRVMGCGLICVVYKTGYHLLRGGKGLQALTEDARTRMGEIVRKGQRVE